MEIPRILELAWEHAFPGREAAERNAILRELRRRCRGRSSRPIIPLPAGTEDWPETGYHRQAVTKVPQPPTGNAPTGRRASASEDDGGLETNGDQHQV